MLLCVLGACAFWTLCSVDRSQLSLQQLCPWSSTKSAVVISLPRLSFWSGLSLPCPPYWQVALSPDAGFSVVGMAPRPSVGARLQPGLPLSRSCSYSSSSSHVRLLADRSVLLPAVVQASLLAVLPNGSLHATVSFFSSPIHQCSSSLGRLWVTGPHGQLAPHPASLTFFVTPVSPPSICN